jgi:hypothetical protein
VNERIDHNNYEAWLLDRLEGNLSEQQLAMLDAFLAANPGLDPGIDELPSLDQQIEHLSSADKNALKRSLPPTGLPAEPIDDHLIAKFEGDLTPKQEQALRAYLIDHPEHQRSERLYEVSRLLPEALAYADTMALARQLPPQGMPTRYTVEDHLVARLEQDLTPEQEHALDVYLLSDEQAQRSWALLQHTRIPAEAVVYEHKQDLKKGVKVIAIGAARAAWVVRLRVAASIAVILGLAIWAFDRSADHGPQVAEQPQEQVPSTTNDSTQEKGRTEELKSDPVETQQRDGSRSAPQILRGGSPQDEHRAPKPQDRSEKNAPPIVPERGAVDRLAGVVPQLPTEPLAQDAPREVTVPEADTFLAARSLEAHKADDRQGIPLSEFVANVFRKQVLDPTSEEEGPLGQADAVAALDKGLRTVGGDRAGLDVEREDDGRVSRFDLRLGRNFAISASR